MLIILLRLVLIHIAALWQIKTVNMLFSIKEFRYQNASRNLLQLAEKWFKWNFILENVFWLCKSPRIALFYLSVILLRKNHDIFTWSVHQIAPFMKIIFKNFLGGAHRAPSPDPSLRFFLGLRPRFGLRPQFSGASRPRLSTKNLSQWIKLFCAPQWESLDPPLAQR